MKRFAKSALAVAMFGLAAQSFAETPKKVDVSPAEKAKIESVVHDYLLKNPEIMVEVMQILQKKQYDQAQQTVKQTQDTAASFANALFHQNNDPVAGNPNGKVTVVEFFDYQCPHCVDMAPIMQSIIKANPDLRVVYKEFPIRGPMSELASRAALAANKQGKYYEFSHALLTSSSSISDSTINDIAKSVGLNMTTFKKDMNSKGIRTELQANYNLARDLGINGTPAFFVGKTDATSSSQLNFVLGEMSQYELQDAISKASN